MAVEDVLAIADVVPWTVCVPPRLARIDYSARFDVPIFGSVEN